MELFNTLALWNSNKNLPLDPRPPRYPAASYALRATVDDVAWTDFRSLGKQSSFGRALGVQGWAWDLRGLWLVSLDLGAGF